MAALLEAMEQAAPAGSPGEAQNALISEAQRHSTTGDAIKASMTTLVKGAGMARIGGNTPLTDQRDITVRAHQATLDLRTSTYQGINDRQSVVKSMNPGFLNQFGNLKTALTTPTLGEQIGQLVSMLPGGGEALKSFTAGNLGIGSVN